MPAMVTLSSLSSLFSPSTASQTDPFSGLRGGDSVTMRDFYRLMSLPADVQLAISTLRDHGAELAKVLALIDPYKRGRGRPPKTTKSAAKTPKKLGAPNLSPLRMPLLAELVANYKLQGLATTDKGAIRQFLSDYSKACGKSVATICANQRTPSATKMTREKYVNSLMERLSRYRRKEGEPLQNSE